MRKPDGVVVEPPSARPEPVAHADAHGVIALREPVDKESVTGVTMALVSAWQRGSLEGLIALLTADAAPLDSAAGPGRAALTESFRQRLQAHEYGRLSGVELVREERIERWDWEDLGNENLGRRDDLGSREPPPRPAEMRPGEIYVRAPLEVTHAAGERLFGSAIVMVLRREGGTLRIAEYGEVDP